MKRIHEELIPLNAAEAIRVVVEPTPRGRVVVRFGLQLQRGNGTEVSTPHFTIEPQHVRTVAAALARVADFIEAERPMECQP